MKRVFAVLGVFALLGTLFLVASSSPASADPSSVTVVNDGANTLNVIAEGCGYQGDTAMGPVAIAPGATSEVPTDTNCSTWTLTAVDATGQCTIQSTTGVQQYTDSDSISNVSPDSDMTFRFRAWNTPISKTAGGCVDEFTFNISKDMTKNSGDGNDKSDDPAGVLTTFTFEFSNDDDRCTAGGVYTVTGEDLPPPAPHGSDGVNFPVVSGYVENNQLVRCIYTTVELGPPAGWTLDHIRPDDYNDGEFECTEVTLSAAKAETNGICAADYAGDGSYTVNFWNSLDPLPLTVTKTFVGRDYYTTVDRGDFHLFMPGLCGNFVMDPFGGLLGSVGAFRTINASQYPQVVFALADVPAALHTDPVRDDVDGRNDPAAGPCTYRVQENNAPDGCVAVDPDGSNADGPYWEQTWIPGETVAFNFNIVNDCAETPDPTPEPTVAPTTDPKKPGYKKPSGGGTAAPKFTG